MSKRNSTDVYEPLLPDRAVFDEEEDYDDCLGDVLIGWDGPSDPENPHNYSFARKVFITSIWVVANWATNISSSIFSSCSPGISREFDSSKTVTNLGISLFLIGYTVGPPCWGPLSERFGRKWPVCIGLLCFTAFSVLVALADNVVTVIVGRFLCGAFGAAPLTIFGGGLVDIWTPVRRGVAMAGCLGAIFGSIILAPIVGNFVAATAGWRWTIWLSAFMGLAAAVLSIIALPETHGATLLRWKADAIKAQTGNPNVRPMGGDQAKDIKTILQIYLVRSFKMLVTEPILLLITIYQAFVYGILYMVFVSFPIAFREVRHWSLGISGLSYTGMFLGVLLGAAVVIRHSLTTYAAQVKRNGGLIIPEQRLPMMCVGGCLFPAGLFIFALTSSPDVHWIGQLAGSVPIAMGIYIVFNQCLNYIIDTYVNTANSAIGANTFVRSFFGASFPLVGPALYHRLGVAWATGLIGLVGICMIPIPLLFYRYGHAIRLRSKNVENKN